MSASPIDLTLAFIESHPEAAVDILEEKTPRDAAFFLEKLPDYYVSQLIGHMLPFFVADLCHAWGAEKSIRYLNDMEDTFVVAVLRCLEGRTLRESILHAVSSGKRSYYKVLLGFSEEMVGAWMDGGPLSIPQSCNVKQALTRISSHPVCYTSNLVYIVDRQRNLLGSVPLASLLQNKPGVSVTSLMEKNVPRLMGRSSLISAAKHPAWENLDVLPVVNRDSKFIGILQNCSLHKGLKYLNSFHSHLPQEIEDSRSNLLTTYGESMLAMISVLKELATQAHTDKEERRP